ncbi:MAG: hypothetical protein K5924_01370 [Chloroflexi bacterium]|nr:hypothetical protein [Chloroflexota bacterium]
MSGTVVITTDDGRDPAYAAMRGAALAWARDRGASVVLYDRSAESYFIDPYPSGSWTADVEGGPDRTRLATADELEMLGRHYLAEQLREAAMADVEIGAWLPPRPGPAAMAEAVSTFGADAVVLPSSLSNPSLLDRVRGNSIERFRSSLSVEVLVGDAHGVRSAGSVTSGSSGP